MNKNNCIIQNHERFIYELKTINETIEWFGEDYLNDYGCKVSNELIERYQKVMKEFKSIQDELYKINKENLKNKY